MKIHELFSGRGVWCQGKLAKDEHGRDVPPESCVAESFCLIGAIRRCYPDPNEYYRTHKRIYAELFGNTASRGDYNVADWNDAEGRTFEEVQALARKLDI